MFDVLKPVYTLNPYAPKFGGDKESWSIDWRKIGTADSMEDAKAIYGGAPVLQKRGE